jgi:hypothetical protein
MVQIIDTGHGNKRVGNYSSPALLKRRTEKCITQRPLEKSMLGEKKGVEFSF